MIYNYMADWSHLQEDILELIFNLGLMLDAVRCGAVCKSWHSFWRDWSVSAGRQLPWLLMLSEDNSTCSDRCDFLSCSTENIMYTNHLPGISGKRFLGSSNNGWWVTVDENQDIQIFHPWRRILRHLPHQSTFHSLSFATEDYSPEELLDMGIQKAFVSPDGRTIVVIYDNRIMGFCRVGDKHWSDFVPRPPPSEGCVEDIVVDRNNYFLNGKQIHYPVIDDVVYHKGKIYAVDSLGCIWLCHIDTQVPNVEQLTHDMFSYRPLLNYLVVDSWTDQMFIVGRHLRFTSYFHQKTLEFDFYEVCLESRSYLCVKSLGNRLLFVGHNSSMLVKASDFPGSKPNCIYFSDDYLHGYFLRHQFKCQDLGIF